MPFFPGMGYGIGTAAVKGLAYKKEYDEAQDLKLRQQKINEDAEKRARDLVDESITTSKHTRMKEDNLQESVDVADSILNSRSSGAEKVADPSTPTANAAMDKVIPDPKGQTSVDQMVAAEYGMGGNPTTDLGDGTEIDQVTGQTNDILPTIGKGGAVPKGSQKPGDARSGKVEAKSKAPTGYGMESSVPATPPGPDAKAEGELRKARSVVAPGEVTGLIAESERLSVRSTEIETRLQEALKTIQARYSGDETMAKYLKANVIAKVRPEIDRMRNQSALASQKAQLAQFTHEAGLFSEGLLGKLETTKNPAEVDAWLNENSATAKKLGIDLERFKGLHKAPDGTIRNKEGYIFPRAAIMGSANGALPFHERIELMKEADKMYKIQEELRSKRMEIAQNDPLRVEKWTIEQKLNFGRAYAKKDYEYQEAKKKVATGGEFTIMVKDEKGNPARDEKGNIVEKKVTVPPQYDPTKPDADWLGGLRNSDNADLREVHKQIINQLELDRSLYDTADRFLGGFKARVQPVNESTITRDNKAYYGKGYGFAVGKMQGAADVEAETPEEGKARRAQRGLSNGAR